MKIKDCNAAALTNFDVLDFLQRRGAANPTRVLVPVAPSEFKVYDYLSQTAAYDQTRESIFTFMEKCKECKNKLAEADSYSISSTLGHLQQLKLTRWFFFFSSSHVKKEIIEQCEVRFPNEELLPLLLELIEALLPPGSSKPEPEEEIEEEEEGKKGKWGRNRKCRA